MNFEDLIERYLALNEYFEKKFKLEGDVRTLARLGKISEELGELNSAVHGELGLHRDEKQKSHTREKMKEEWADVFNTVVLFGLSMGIDVPKTIDERLDEIFDRLGVD